jgi:hypothetical protein
MEGGQKHPASASTDNQLLPRRLILSTSPCRFPGSLRPRLLDSVRPFLLVVLELMSRTDALPVHYVFPRQKLDVEDAGRALLAASSELAEGSHKGVMVVWDVSYDWLSGTSVAHGDTCQHFCW